MLSRAESRNIVIFGAILLGVASGAAPSLAQDAPAAATSGATVQLTIADAVARALETSPRIKQAAAERDAQKERRRGAWADVGPRVKGEFNLVRWEDEQTVNFGGQEIVMRPKESQVGSLTAYQPITGGVALSAKAGLEGTQAELKEMSLTLTRSEVAYQTAELWLKAYQARRQLEISLQSVAAAESQQRDAAALERAGRMNRGDVLKLELAVSEAKARAAQARAQVEVTDAGLREAIGLPPDAMLAIAGELPTVSTSVPERDAAVKDAMDRRLEPKLAEGGVDAAGFGKKLAYTNFSPSVNLFAKVERNFGEQAGLSGGGSRDTKTYGVQASWDLWNNGAHVFAVREAADQIVKAEEGVRGAAAQVRLDVQTALASLKAADESLSLAKVAVTQAAEAYRIEQVRFRTGSRSATDLILAETSNASAQGRLVTAQSDHITWNLRLRKALGDELPKL